MKPVIAEALKEMKTQQGVSLQKLTQGQAVMVVFLRHFGCIFCMESMKDLSERMSTFKERKVKVCLVHMAANDVAEGFFKDYGLEGVDHVSDIECVYYEKFGLLKGGFTQLFGLQVWMRTAQLAIKDFSKLKRAQIGDGLQMPGVFLIKDDKILEQYIHAKASDRPDYVSLSECCKIS